MINFDLCINTVDLRFQIYFSVNRIQQFNLFVNFNSKKDNQNHLLLLVDQSS